MPHSKNSDPNKYRPQRDCYDKANLVLLILAFLAASAAAIGLFRQANIFSAQLTEMQNVYGPIKESAAAAKQAADIAERTLRISQTAILSFLDWETKNIEVGKSPYFKVKVLNVGHTGATIIDDPVSLTIDEKLPSQIAPFKGQSNKPHYRAQRRPLYGSRFQCN